MYNTSEQRDLKEEVAQFNSKVETLQIGDKLDLGQVRQLLETYKNLEAKVEIKNRDIEARNKINQEQAMELLVELNILGKELNLVEASPETIYVDLENNINTLIRG